MAIALSSGILENLFAPLDSPFASRAEPQNTKGAFQHIAEYFETYEGAWDLFRIVNTALNFPQVLAPQSGELVGRIREVADTAGIGLSIPQIFSNGNNLHCSIGNLLSKQDLPDSDPLRTRKITQAARKVFVDSMNLTNSFSQAALFVNQTKLFSFELGQLNMLEGVYNVTSAISDGVELIGECFKLQQYHSPDIVPNGPGETAKLEEKKTLAWMTIAKDAASIALAAITLVGIAFGIATQSIALLPPVILALSTFWLTMKLASYFYKKVVVDALSPI